MICFSGKVPDKLTATSILMCELIARSENSGNSLSLSGIEIESNLFSGIIPDNEQPNLGLQNALICESNFESFSCNKSDK